LTFAEREYYRAYSREGGDINERDTFTIIRRSTRG